MRRALMIVGAVGLTACFPAVRGNHRIVAQARSVGAFERLSVADGIHAEVRVGDTWSVELEGDENLLPFIVTEVVDGVLEVHEGDWLDPTRPILLRVVTPRVSSVRSAGGASVVVDGAQAAVLTLNASGGDLELRGVRTDSVELSARGPARVVIEGEARSLLVEAAGGVDLDAGRLLAESVTLRGSSGAQGIVHASVAIDGWLADGAAFTVVGGPLSSWLSASGGARLTFGR